MTLALAQVVHAFNARSQRRSAFTPAVHERLALGGGPSVPASPAGRGLLCRCCRPCSTRFRPLPVEWAVIAACSLAPVAVVEIVKLLRLR